VRLKDLKGEAMRAAAVLLLVFTLAPAGATTLQNSKLATVKRIYVDSMGQTDAAVRFRQLLRDDLGKAGFEVAATPATADASLGGVLSTRKVLRRRIHAYATVALTTADGGQIWGGYFREPIFRLTLSNDAVAVRARDIVKKLKADTMGR
jgi:hypothetical protein